MPRKTLSYHEITKLTRDLITEWADQAANCSHDADDYRKWAIGTRILWLHCALELRDAEDQSAKENYDDDHEAFKVLFEKTLEKLREEAAQAGKEN